MALGLLELERVMSTSAIEVVEVKVKIEAKITYGPKSYVNRCLVAYAGDGPAAFAITCIEACGRFCHSFHSTAT